MTANTMNIIYEVGHLLDRLGVFAPSGIDRVDLAFARHFAFTDACNAVAVASTKFGPRFFSQDDFRNIVTRAEQGWKEDVGLEDDATFQCTRLWLREDGTPGPRVVATHTGARPKLPLRLRYGRSMRAMPADAVYVNIAQHRLEYESRFRWLERHPGLTPVFFWHDLLPFDYPEYFRVGERAIFEARFQTMVRFAKGCFVSTGHVKERMARELEHRSLPALPIHQSPLPSPLQPPATSGSDVRLPAYCVVVGTIEPRKNHLLLLNIWRHLAASGTAVTKLVVVGQRGWECEQVADMLDRCEALRTSVGEVRALSAGALAFLIVHARAMLMPSFAEGYGLPIVEALSLGVPVIASDIAVFREVAQGRAKFVSALDGPGWMRAIDECLSRPEPLRAQAAHFVPPTWDGYFSGIDRFLARI